MLRCCPLYLKLTCLSYSFSSVPLSSVSDIACMTLSLHRFFLYLILPHCLGVVIDDPVAGPCVAEKVGMLVYKLH